MGSEQPIETMPDWMRNVERRQNQQERRHSVQTADEILGPGFGPTATYLTDWNADEATFGGFFWSDTNSANSPDSTKQWAGIVVVTDGNLSGVQKVFAVSADTLEEYRRRFTDPGDGTARTYSAWVQTGGTVAQGNFGDQYVGPHDYLMDLIESPSGTALTAIQDPSHAGIWGLQLYNGGSFYGSGKWMALQTNWAYKIYLHHYVGPDAGQMTVSLSYYPPPNFSNGVTGTWEDTGQSTKTVDCYAATAASKFTALASLVDLRVPSGAPDPGNPVRGWLAVTCASTKNASSTSYKVGLFGAVVHPNTALT